MDLKKDETLLTEPLPTNVNKIKQNASPENHEKNIFRQQFLQEWLFEKKNQPWLRPHPTNKYKFRCITCNRTYTAKYTTIRYHRNCPYHLKRLKQRGTNVIENVKEYNKEQLKLDEALIKTLLISMFAKHDLPPLLIDDLLPLIKFMSFNFPEALQKVKMSRTSMTNLLNEVYAPHIKKDLEEKLMNFKFSTLFDESTDFCGKKHGAVQARHVDLAREKVVTRLYDLPEIYTDESDATGKGLFNTIIGSFNHFETIPEKQFEGFCSDGAATMTGAHEGVSTQISEKYPNTLNIECLCHKAHLCAKHAAEKLPEEIFNFLTKAYNFLKPPKRTKILRKHQDLLKVKLHQILRFIPQRWLNTGPCARRLVEQWDPIKDAIEEINKINEKSKNTDKSSTGKEILSLINKPTTKCFLMFIGDSIKILENLNGQLQTEDAILPLVFDKISEAYEKVLRFIFNDSYIDGLVSAKDLCSVEFYSKSNFKKLDKIYIGEKDTIEEVKKLSDDDKKVFYNNCFKYLHSMADEMSWRLYEYWELHEPFKFLDPKNVFSQKFHEENPTIINDAFLICQRAADCDNEKVPVIDSEWAKLIEFEQIIDSNLPPDTFWCRLYKLKNDNGDLLFPNVSQFALNLLVIPHSNSSPERVWSKERLTLTRLRNRMSTKTLTSWLMVNDYIKSLGYFKDLCNFKPSLKLLLEIVNYRFKPKKKKEKVILEDLLKEEVGDLVNKIGNMTKNQTSFVVFYEKRHLL